MFSSLVSAVIVEERVVPGTTPIHLPASSAYGSAAALDGLDGLRTVAPLPGGLLRSITRATSDTVTLEQVTDMDPRTGLIAHTSKTVQVRAAGLEKLSTATITVEPMAR
jgi:hypothetical protein